MGEIMLFIVNTISTTKGQQVPIGEMITML